MEPKRLRSHRIAYLIYSVDSGDLSFLMQAVIAGAIKSNLELATCMKFGRQASLNYCRKRESKFYFFLQTVAKMAIATVNIYNQKQR